MRNDIQSFVEELNNMFYTDRGYKSFPVDVIEEKNDFKVFAEIPGVAKEDIQLTFEDGKLTINASMKKDKDKKYVLRERNGYRYQREIYFGDIEEDTLNAKYIDGVLEITIKTKAPEAKEKKIITIE